MKMQNLKFQVITVKDLDYKKKTKGRFLIFIYNILIIKIIESNLQI